MWCMQGCVASAASKWGSGGGCTIDYMNGMGGGIVWINLGLGKAESQAGETTSTRCRQKQVSTGWLNWGQTLAGVLGELGEG